MRALRREWELARDRRRDVEPPRGRLLGGGTPTALDPDSLRSLLAWFASAFDLSRRARVDRGGESRGADGREARSSCARAASSRLSLGVQSLEPAVLRTLGRIHTAGQALDALARARRAGFANLSADFIVAVPGETADGRPRSIEASRRARRRRTSRSTLSRWRRARPLARQGGAGRDSSSRQRSDAAERYDGAGPDPRERGLSPLRGVELGAAGIRVAPQSRGTGPGAPTWAWVPGAHSFDGETRWRNDEDDRPATTSASRRGNCPARSGRRSRIARRRRSGSCSGSAVRRGLRRAELTRLAAEGRRRLERLGRPGRRGPARPAGTDPADRARASSCATRSPPSSSRGGALRAPTDAPAVRARLTPRRGAADRFQRRWHLHCRECQPEPIR